MSRKSSKNCELSHIQANDVFEELFEENKRLLIELKFANECMNTFIEFKTFINNICHKFVNNLDSNESQKFDRLKESIERVLSKTNGQKISIRSQQLYENTINTNIDSDDTIDNNFEEEDHRNSGPKKSKYRRNSDESYEEQTDDNGSDSNWSAGSLDSGREGQSYECDICSLRFVNKFNLKKHKSKDHKDSQPFRCDYKSCGFFTFRKLQFTYHMKKHRGVQPMACPNDSCNYTTYSDRGLKRHILNHKRCFVCNLCGNKYITKQNLDQHYDNHNKYGLKCDFVGCNYQTLIKKDFEVHMNHHKGVKPFECQFESCGQSFRRKFQLKKHIHTVHELVEPQCVCDFPNCGKKYRYDHHLRHHKLIHSEPKYVCTQPDCDFRTAFPNKLSVHLLKHSSERPHPCPINCGKYFYTQNAAKIHSEIHSNQCTFVCTHEGCGKTFKTSHYLLSHKQTHNEKNKTCDWPGCEYTTNLTSKLTLHKKVVHIQHKNYKCEWPQCDRAYKTRYELTVHTRRHTGDQRHECSWPGCDLKFFSSQSLKLHIQKTHQI